MSMIKQQTSIVRCVWRKCWRNVGDTDIDLRLVVPDRHGAAVEADHHPWLRGVQVHALHPV